MAAAALRASVVPCWSPSSGACEAALKYCRTLILFLHPLRFPGFSHTPCPARGVNPAKVTTSIGAVQVCTLAVVTREKQESQSRPSVQAEATQGAMSALLWWGAAPKLWAEMPLNSCGRGSVIQWTKRTQPTSNIASYTERAPCSKQSIGTRHQDHGAASWSAKASEAIDNTADGASSSSANSLYLVGGPADTER